MKEVQQELNRNFYRLEEKFNNEEEAIERIEEEMLRAAITKDIDYLHYLVEERRKHLKKINKIYSKLEKVSDLMSEWNILF